VVCQVKGDKISEMLIFWSLLTTIESGNWDCCVKWLEPEIKPQKQFKLCTEVQFFKVSLDGRSNPKT